MNVRVALAVLVALPAHASLILSPGTVVANSLGESNPSNNGIDRAISQFALSTSYTSGVTNYTDYFSPAPGPADQLNTYAAANLTGAVDFDLGAEFYLVGLALWNLGANSAVNNFKVLSSPDNTFTTLTVLTDDNAIPDPTAGANFFAQLFTFTNPGTTRYVRFEVLSNHNNTLLGFAELAFEADTEPPPVPTPELSSFLLVAAGGMAFLLWARSRSQIPS